MGVMRQVIETTITTIEAIPALNLRLAPPAVQPENIPNTIAEKVFTVTMQTENTDKFRDRQPAGQMRLGHAVTVSLMCRLLPNNQIEGYDDAIDIEEAIILAMLVQASFPAYRVLYDRTRRTVTDGGEYVLLEIDFSIEQSIGLA